MNRILIVKTSAMGDIVANIPLINDIHARFPHIAIDWVVEESFLEIAKLSPYINEFIPLGLRRWKKNPFSRQTWQEIGAFRARLKSQHYDAVLDSQNLVKSALICRLANGVSHGANYSTAREPLAGLLHQKGYDITVKCHAAIRNRMLGAKVFGYAMPEDSPQYQLNVPAISINYVPENPYIMGFHGTARAAKLWPVDHWVKIAEHLKNKGLDLLLPWGSADEKQRAETIALASSNMKVLPKLSLSELTCLTQRARASIGVDTGLMHLSVALNIPTLAIFCDTHIWQAGTYPAQDTQAITIGGKPALPTVEEAIAAFDQLKLNLQT